MTDIAVKQDFGTRRSLESWIRTARLSSGLVIMAFVILHFANHLLLLVSIEAAEIARLAFMAVWRNPLGTILLYGSLLAHVALTLLALYRRRTLRMSVREALQLAMGLIIPLLIADHVIGTRVNYALTGIDDTYAYVVGNLWTDWPRATLRQCLAVVAVWLHGCLGLFFWLRYRPWFERWSPVLLVLAALTPVLVLLAFVDAGRTLEDTSRPAAPAAPTIAPAIMETRQNIRSGVYGVYGAAILLVVAARGLRARRVRRDVVEVRYGGGQSVRIQRGHSVLEASRLGGIPHYSVCGGRGRCSTCRVRVLDTSAPLPAIEAPELGTLKRIHAEPDVRLACQLRPKGDIKLELLLETANLKAAALPAATAPGRERDVAILFCDMRSFTALSSHKLPFDTVFLLNRYFAVVGQAVEKAGGRLDKFIGDGAMAIFGLDAPKAEACRQALQAAADIVAAVALLSEELMQELREPLRVAIGIHAGPAIVGTMGYGRAVGVTAIGDTVNVASRLESIAKEHDAVIAISATAVAQSGFDFSSHQARTVEIRGGRGPIVVFTVAQGAAFDLRDAPATAAA